MDGGNRRSLPGEFCEAGRFPSVPAREPRCVSAGGRATEREVQQRVPRNPFAGTFAFGCRETGETPFGMEREEWRSCESRAAPQVGAHARGDRTDDRSEE